MIAVSDNCQCIYFYYVVATFAFTLMGGNLGHFRTWMSLVVIRYDSFVSILGCFVSVVIKQMQQDSYVSITTFWHHPWLIVCCFSGKSDYAPKALITVVPHAEHSLSKGEHTFSCASALPCRLGQTVNLASYAEAQRHGCHMAILPDDLLAKILSAVPLGKAKVCMQAVSRCAEGPAIFDRELILVRAGLGSSVSSGWGSRKVLWYYHICPEPALRLRSTSSSAVACPQAVNNSWPKIQC